MRYADYLNRSMDALTAATWAKLLSAPEFARSICTSVHVFCPFCRAALNVDVALSVSPLPEPNNSADETLIELAAVTDADIAVRAERLAV